MDNNARDKWQLEVSRQLGEIQSDIKTLKKQACESKSNRKSIFGAVWGAVCGACASLGVWLLTKQ